MKKTMVLIPFGVMPPRATFRFKKRWWVKLTGRLNVAIEESTSRKKPKDWKMQLMEDSDVIAIFKEDLEKRNYYQILKEEDIWV